MHRRPIEHPTEALEFGAALSSAMAPTTPNDARGECPPDSPPRVPDSSKHWHDAKKQRAAAPALPLTSISCRLSSARYASKHALILTHNTSA